MDTKLIDRHTCPNANLVRDVIVTKLVFLGRQKDVPRLYQSISQDLDLL